MTIKIFMVVTLIFTTVLLAACATQATPTLQPAPTTTAVSPLSTLPPLPLPTPTVAPLTNTTTPRLLPTSTVARQAGTPATTIEIGDKDNGKTFNATVGTHIQVVLHSTYWQFAQVTNPAIKQLGEPVAAPDTSVRVPGGGAGILTIQYDAVAPGQATIQANRNTCGEVLLCAPDQSNWQVTIAVK